MKSEKAKVERCEIPKHRGEKHALSLSKGVAQPRHAELVEAYFFQCTHTAGLGYRHLGESERSEVPVESGDWLIKLVPVSVPRAFRGSLQRAV